MGQQTCLKCRYEEYIRFLIREKLREVLFGQHIPKEIAKELIDKLKGMSELGLKNRVRHVHYLPSMPRTENKNLYEIIDKIDEAIQGNRKIRVKRCYIKNKNLVKGEICLWYGTV